jgi:adenosylcobinamide-phosphate synthase
MKFLALLAALACEQLHPLRGDNAVHAAYGRFAAYLRHLLDAGQQRQGVWTWVIAVAPLTVLVLVADWLLARISGALALLFGAAVLYVTVGFRQFSNYFNEINRLMKDGDLNGAREQLRQWRNADSSALDSNAIARVAIELGLMASHRHVFGPVAWFLLFGPAGALLYRMAALLQETWRARAAIDPGLSDEFAKFAERAFAVIDWAPARLTAASFAAVGNFQDAVDCWRAQAATWAHGTQEAQGIILASGAGALGVKLGGPLQASHEAGGETFDPLRPELGTGDEADADYLSSAVGLIWRALVMWMLLAGVVTIAHSLG